MRRWEEKSYDLQISMFFLTAIGVVFTFFSMSIALFALLDNLPKKQSANMEKVTPVIETPARVKSITIEPSSSEDKTVELVALHEKQISTHFKNQDLRGSIGLRYESASFTLVDNGSFSKHYMVSPSIIRFSSTRN